MTCSTRLLVAASLTGLVAGCAATEPEMPETVPAAYDVLDRGSHGWVTRDAWDDHGRTVHAQIDTDGDGGLDANEIRRSFSVFDIDKSGSLTTDEVHFPLIDGNGDGMISAAEWDGERVLRALDLQRDGKVTLEEMNVRRQVTFTELDRNATGRISRHELDGSPPFTLFWL